MSQSLVFGAIWSFLQRFGSLAIGFVSNIVLARLLFPADFGIMAMVMAVVSMADVLVDGGLGNALIQKKAINPTDISTVFTTNLLFSICLFLICYISAPWLQNYTGVEHLTLYVRFESLLIIIRAFYVVPASLLNKELKFKHIAKATLSVNFMTTTISIVLAYSGYGVWSLLIRNILIDLGLAIFYFIALNKHTSHRHVYKLGFDRLAFNKLFGFGIFIVMANLIESTYTHLSSFIIGKNSSMKDLGLYNQAYSLQQIPVYSLTSGLNQVLFPYFSKMQGNNYELRNKLKISIGCTTFCILPIMTLLIISAEDIINILYSSKWAACVPFFQLFCLAGCFNAIIHINRSILKSLGYSKYIFSIQLFSTIFGICLLIFGLRHSLLFATVLFVINTVLLYIITSWFAGRKVGYSLFEQCKDFAPNMIIAAIAGFIGYLILIPIENDNHILRLIIAILVVSSIFLVSNLVLNTNSFQQILLIYKQVVRK